MIKALFKSPPNLEQAKTGITVTLNELLALGHPKFKHAAQHLLNPQIGNHLSSFRGHGMIFDQVRRYESGDDIRHMDWRITARTHKPHTKLFQQEKQHPTYIIVDQSTALFFGSQIELKSVTAAKVAAFFAWKSFSQGDRLGGLIFGDHHFQTIKPRSGKSGLYHFFRPLVEYNQALSQQSLSEKPQQTFDLHEMLHLFSHQIPPGSWIIFISDFDFFNQQTPQALANLAHHNQLMGISIYDVLEQELPPPNHYTFSNGIATQTLNTAPLTLRKQFQEAFIHKHALLENAFQKIGARYLKIATHQTPFDWLRS